MLPYYLNELQFSTVLKILVLEREHHRLHLQIRHVVGRHPVADIEDVAAY